mmetsp:Transcript_9212/g.8621  ORF Transcript_9212/g.8621 Transcript_9212/m.8621 type:complete len:88 (+) Transcript_9212:441-704(+)
MISKNRFTVLKRTLMTPKALKRRGRKDVEEDHATRLRRKDSEWQKKKLIKNSLFGKKIQNAQLEFKQFQEIKFKNKMTISIDTLSAP